MDENNKYGKAMIKPFPYGCIKKQKHPPSLTEFNKILTNRSYEGHIGNHLLLTLNFVIKILKLYYLTKYIDQYLKNIKKWSLTKGRIFSL